jgi:2-polyprenyl-6-methoxyphenol hydroxylase-like FAD-dependent oxidoreductase
MREDRTEVLVVGAGPVGLTTALLLADSGIEVRIIDREANTTSRSYACAVHPRVLTLLQRFGLATELISQGRAVNQVQFFEGDTCRASLDLDRVGGPYPFVLIVPQSGLESALERRLHERFGVKVEWNHRFDDFKQEQDGVVATIQKLGGTSTGYVVPHWEEVVKGTFNLRARFLIGADGQRSLVRQRAGLEQIRKGDPQFFAAYEFVSDTPPDDEVRVVIDDTTTNVLWPQLGNKYRWTFQLVKSEISADFPEKERRSARVANETVDERIRAYVQKIAGKRAPWFKAAVKEVTWCTHVVFEHRLAKHFGHDYCWLVGDAAHQTGPVGAQSMNVGMLEAEALVSRLVKVVREQAEPSLIQTYDQECRRMWEPLLDPESLRAGPEATPWVVGRRARLLPCFPASGEDIAGLAGQLGLFFQT